MRLLFLIFKKIIIIIVWIIIKDAHVYLRYIYIYTVSDKRGTGRRDYYVL